MRFVEADTTFFYVSRSCLWPRCRLKLCRVHSLRKKVSTLSDRRRTLCSARTPQRPSRWIGRLFDENDPGVQTPQFGVHRFAQKGDALEDAPGDGDGRRYEQAWRSGRLDAPDAPNDQAGKISQICAPLLDHVQSNGVAFLRRSGKKRSELRVVWAGSSIGVFNQRA